jgi:hypothetical protein
MLDRAIPDINPNHVRHKLQASQSTLRARVQRPARSLVVQGKVGSLRGGKPTLRK